MIPRDGPEGRWLDREAGPVVRPYAVTNGRTAPEGGESFGLIDVMAATGEPTREDFRPGPEHRRILRICGRPTAVVDLASEMDLPVGVVRVLLGDLTRRGMLRTVSGQREQAPDQRLLRMVLNALQSL